MPNGFHGTASEWMTLAAPLQAVDHLIDRFAAEHGAAVGRNERGWPNRVIRWIGDLNRKIELVLADDPTAAFRLNIVAWKDELGKRHWRSKTVADEIESAVMPEQLNGLLESARRELFSWEATDLQVEQL